MLIEVVWVFEPGAAAEACCHSGTGRLDSRAVVLRFRFQRSVYLGIYPRSASFLFCQIKTFKRYVEFCLLSLSYHFNTSNPKEKRIYIIKGEKKRYSFKLNAFCFIKNSLHCPYFAHFVTEQSLVFGSEVKLLGFESWPRYFFSQSLCFLFCKMDKWYYLSYRVIKRCVWHNKACK